MFIRDATATYWPCGSTAMAVASVTASRSWIVSRSAPSIQSRLPSPSIATSDPSSLMAAETTGPGARETERNWPWASIR